MIPLSLQLWTLDEEVKKDFASTVMKVAGIGFRFVELVHTGNLSATEARDALERANLRVSGMHVGWEALTGGLGRIVEEAALFGTREIILSGAPKEHFISREKCLTLGDYLGRLGGRYRAEGLCLSYHNHEREFAIVEGRPAMEWMLSAAAPRDLGAQIDVYWVLRAGIDPVRALGRLGTRARQLHLKDGVEGTQTELGSGRVNFPAIFDLVEKNGTMEWYVVEQEQFRFSPMESVRIDFEFLRLLGKAGA